MPCNPIACRQALAHPFVDDCEPREASCPAESKNGPDAVRQSEDVLEQKFDDVSGNFMRFMDPEVKDSRIRAISDGRIRSALFEILQEIRKVI